MGAFAGATFGWIAWGIMSFGSDCFACSASISFPVVDVSILALAVLGGRAAFMGRSKPARIAVTLATALCGLF